MVQEYKFTADNCRFFVGLGWDVKSAGDSHEEFDLDASAFLLSWNDSVLNASDCVYFNNLKHPSGAVEHTGDNRTGEGEGDDEAILVDLSKMPKDVTKIVFAATVYEGEERHQSFGQVKNAYIRLYDEELGELFRFDLAENFTDETAVIFGVLRKLDDEWIFSADGRGFGGSIVSLCTRYGVFRKH